MLQTRLATLHEQLEQNHAAINETRSLLESLNEEVNTLDTKIKIAGEEYIHAENEFNAVNGLYNENNLLLAKQQSKVNALATGT